MDTTFILMLSSVVVVSLLSLVGVSLLNLGHKVMHEVIFGLVALAVGALFGDCFLHLLPEAYRGPLGEVRTSLLVLTGILSFLALENFLHWRHQHSDEEHEVEPLGYLNLLADMAHNGIDGLLIGASYRVSVEIGLTTSLAVMLHEIPHEFSNFGILVKSGFTRKQALWLNFLTALTAVGGGLAAWWMGSRIGSFGLFLVPLTAGSFIYIAGSDLVPQLNKTGNPVRAVLQFLAILAGVGLMLALKVFE